MFASLVCSKFISTFSYRLTLVLSSSLSLSFGVRALIRIKWFFPFLFHLLSKIEYTEGHSVTFIWSSYIILRISRKFNEQANEANWRVNWRSSKYSFTFVWLMAWLSELCSLIEQSTTSHNSGHVCVCVCACARIFCLFIYWFIIALKLFGFRSNQIWSGYQE